MEEKFDLSLKRISKSIHLYDENNLIIYLQRRIALDELLYNSEITAKEHAQRIDELTGDDLNYNFGKYLRKLTNNKTKMKEVKINGRTI